MGYTSKLTRLHGRTTNQLVKAQRLSVFLSYPPNINTPILRSQSYPLVNIQKAIENGPVEIVDFPMKNGGSFHSYVKLPEGNMWFHPNIKNSGLWWVFNMNPEICVISGIRII